MGGPMSLLARRPGDRRTAMRKIRLVVSAHRKPRTRRAFSAPAIVKAGEVPEHRRMPVQKEAFIASACAGHQNHPASQEHPFMYHCHILEHEDAGMMGQYVCA